MTEFIRTPEDNFTELRDFKFRPYYHKWQDMRLHYLDEGPRDGPVMLLLHGMPTWSYLYRDFIFPLTQAGYRCIAPDYLGFGRSDKPTDIHWYTIARHTEVLSTLLVHLDLQNINLICQDWGGPIGLAQAAMMPNRFERLIIMNTWLHHGGYEYCENVNKWITAWEDNGFFAHKKPDVALIPLLDAGLITRKDFYEASVSGITPEKCITVISHL
jgi:haloalkane dehalogenase